MSVVKFCYDLLQYDNTFYYHEREQFIALQSFHSDMNNLIPMYDINLMRTHRTYRGHGVTKTAGGR